MAATPNVNVSGASSAASSAGSGAAGAKPAETKPATSGQSGSSGSGAPKKNNGTNSNSGQNQSAKKSDSKQEKNKKNEEENKKKQSSGKENERDPHKKNMEVASAAGQGAIQGGGYGALAGVIQEFLKDPAGFLSAMFITTVAIVVLITSIAGVLVSEAWYALVGTDTKSMVDKYIERQNTVESTCFIPAYKYVSDAALDKIIELAPESEIFENKDTLRKYFGQAYDGMKDFSDRGYTYAAYDMVQNGLGRYLPIYQDTSTGYSDENKIINNDNMLQVTENGYEYGISRWNRTITIIDFNTDSGDMNKDKIKYTFVYHNGKYLDGGYSMSMLEEIFGYVFDARMQVAANGVYDDAQKKKVGGEAEQLDKMIGNAEKYVNNGLRIDSRRTDAFSMAYDYFLSLFKEDKEYVGYYLDQMFLERLNRCVDVYNKKHDTEIDKIGSDMNKIKESIEDYKASLFLDMIKQERVWKNILQCTVVKGVINGGTYGGSYVMPIYANGKNAEPKDGELISGIKKEIIFYIDIDFCDTKTLGEIFGLYTKEEKGGKTTYSTTDALENLLEDSEYKYASDKGKNEDPLYVEALGKFFDNCRDAGASAASLLTDAGYLKSSTFWQFKMKVFNYIFCNNDVDPLRLPFFVSKDAIARDENGAMKIVKIEDSDSIEFDRFNENDADELSFAAIVGGILGLTGSPINNLALLATGGLTWGTTEYDGAQAEIMKSEKQYYVIYCDPKTVVSLRCACSLSDFSYGFDKYNNAGLVQYLTGNGRLGSKGTYNIYVSKAGDIEMPDDNSYLDNLPFSLGSYCFTTKNGGGLGFEINNIQYTTTGYDGTETLLSTNDYKQGYYGGFNRDETWYQEEAQTITEYISGHNGQDSVKAGLQANPNDSDYQVKASESTPVILGSVQDPTFYGKDRSYVWSDVDSYPWFTVNVMTGIEESGLHNPVDIYKVFDLDEVGNSPYYDEESTYDWPIINAFDHEVDVVANFDGEIIVSSAIENNIKMINMEGKTVSDTDGLGFVIIKTAENSFCKVYNIIPSIGSGEVKAEITSLGNTDDKGAKIIYGYWDQDELSFREIEPKNTGRLLIHRLRVFGRQSVAMRADSDGGQYNNVVAMFSGTVIEKSKDSIKVHSDEEGLTFYYEPNGKVSFLQTIKEGDQVSVGQIIGKIYLTKDNGYQDSLYASVYKDANDYARESAKREWKQNNPEYESDVNSIDWLEKIPEDLFYYNPMEFYSSISGESVQKRRTISITTKVEKDGKMSYSRYTGGFLNKGSEITLYANIDTGGAESSDLEWYIHESSVEGLVTLYPSEDGKTCIIRAIDKEGSEGVAGSVDVRCHFKEGDGKTAILAIAVPDYYVTCDVSLYVGSNRTKDESFNVSQPLYIPVNGNTGALIKDQYDFDSVATVGSIGAFKYSLRGNLFNGSNVVSLSTVGKNGGILNGKKGQNKNLLTAIQSSNGRGFWCKLIITPTLSRDGTLNIGVEEDDIKPVEIDLCFYIPITYESGIRYEANDGNGVSNRVNNVITLKKSVNGKAGEYTFGESDFTSWIGSEISQYDPTINWDDANSVKIKVSNSLLKIKGYENIDSFDDEAGVPSKTIIANDFGTSEVDITVYDIAGGYQRYRFLVKCGLDVEGICLVYHSFDPEGSTETKKIIKNESTILFPAVSTGIVFESRQANGSYYELCFYKGSKTYEIPSDLRSNIKVEFDPAKDVNSNIVRFAYNPTLSAIGYSLRTKSALENPSYEQSEAAYGGKIVGTITIQANDIYGKDYDLTFAAKFVYVYDFSVGIDMLSITDYYSGEFPVYLKGKALKKGASTWTTLQSGTQIWPIGNSQYQFINLNANGYSQAKFTLYQKYMDDNNPDVVYWLARTKPWTGG